MKCLFKALHEHHRKRVNCKNGGTGMAMFAPKYYERFRCIAERCTHSCCVGWEIDVDRTTYSLYRALEGEIGERIRKSITIAEDGSTCFAMRADGRCPHLDERGLCRIICGLGEDYLCDICAEHPRFYNEVAGRTECGIGASCEEAARLILAESDYTDMVCIEEETEENAETGGEFDVLHERSALYALLSGKEPLGERLERIRQRFGVSEAMSRERSRALLEELEYLDSEHRALFLSCELDCDIPPSAQVPCERFLAYLIYRHASPEQNAQGFGEAVGMSLFLTGLFAAMICHERMDAVRSARILSEEIEYCEQNMEQIRRALCS